MEHADYLVDLVDDSGAVVGQKVRRDIDKQVDWYNGVYVLMITPQGEMVLGGIIERQDLPNIYAHTLGVTVGAIRRHRETALGAAKRALRRELLIKPANVVPLGEAMVTFDDGHRTLFSGFYTVDEPPTTYSTIDIDDLRVISPEQFQDELSSAPQRFAPSLRTFWELYRDQLPI